MILSSNEVILNSASRRSQHYSPAGSAKGRDGGCPRLRSQPVAQGTGTAPPSHGQDPTPHPGWIPPRIPAGSGAVCTLGCLCPTPSSASLIVLPHLPLSSQ